MTISSSAMSLYDGSLVSRLQDALGNSGATVTVTDGSTKLTGTPTGAGLKARSTALNVKIEAPTHKDVISFSPAARTALTNQEIGLKLILAAKDGSDGVLTKSSPVAPKSVPVPNKSSSIVDVSDVETLAQEDPTQVIYDVVTAGQNTFDSLSTTQGFTAAASADPNFLKSFTDGMPDDLGAGFLAALKNGTLTVESGAQTGFTGGSITVTGTSVSGNGYSGKGNFDLSTTNVVTVGFSGFGVLAFGWPKTQS